MLLSSKKILLLSMGLAFVLTVLVILSRSGDSENSERNAYKYSEAAQIRKKEWEQRKAHSDMGANMRLSERPVPNNLPSRTRKVKDGNPIEKQTYTRRQRPSRDDSDGINLQKSRDLSTAEPKKPCICEKGQPFELHEKTVPSKTESKERYMPSRLQSFWSSDKFTSVVTSSSTDNIATFLDHYCHSETHKTLCSRLIVVWTLDSSDIAQDLLGHPCPVPLHFKHHRNFQVTDKYKTYPEIDTNSILILEDTELLSDNDIILGFQTWQQFRYKIVGFEAYGHKLTKQHTFKYVPVSTEGQYSFVTGKSIFIHRTYLETFFQDVPIQLLQFVQKNRTGGEMVLNAIVADYLAHNDQPQCSGILVYRKKKKLGPKRPSTEQDLVQELNDYCLSLISQAYGGMPLQFSSIMITQATAGWP